MFDEGKFREAVNNSGKTMEDVSNHLGINNSTLWRKVTGKTEFTRTEIQLICGLLHLDSPNEIFFAKELT